MKITDEMVERRFAIGDRVTKIKGSKWTGRVVGFYSTALTPVGYAVESETEAGSVQIYPEAALSAAPPVEYAGLVERLQVIEAICIEDREVLKKWLQGNHRLRVEAADAITALEARARDAEARIREPEAAFSRERERIIRGLDHLEVFPGEQPSYLQILEVVEDRAKWLPDWKAAASTREPTKWRTNSPLGVVEVVKFRGRPGNGWRTILPDGRKGRGFDDSNAAKADAEELVRAAIRARTQADAPAQPEGSAS